MRPDDLKERAARAAENAIGDWLIHIEALGNGSPGGGLAQLRNARKWCDICKSYLDTLEGMLELEHEREVDRVLRRPPSRWRRLVQLWKGV